MIKYLMALFMLMVNTALGAEPFQYTVDGKTKETTKVTYIDGDIDDMQYMKYFLQVSGDYTEPGDRVIIISSAGGRVSSGKSIIDMMEKEKKVMKIKLVCFVKDEATSMAFNILSHCDKRYANKEARFLVHKIYMVSGNEPLTEKMLRWMADELHKDEEPYTRLNSKLMHLTRKQYDDYAEAQTVWSAPELLKRRYLHGIAEYKTEEPEPTPTPSQ